MVGEQRYVFVAEGPGRYLRRAVTTGREHDGKVAIHPGHIPVIREAYAPTVEEIKWATAVLDAVEHNRGVFAFRGQMVDAPVLAHARRIVARRPM